MNADWILVENELPKEPGLYNVKYKYLGEAVCFASTRYGDQKVVWVKLDSMIITHWNKKPALP